MKETMKRLMGMVTAMLVYMAVAVMPAYADNVVITGTAREAMQANGGPGVAVTQEAETPEVVDENETSDREEDPAAKEIMGNVPEPEVNPVSEETVTEPVPVIHDDVMEAEQEEAEFVADGDVDASLVAMANEYLDMLPQEVRVKFHENGWNLMVTNKNLANTFFRNAYYSVAGVTTWDDHGKYIYIENRANAIRHAAIHETGHAVDQSLGMASCSQEFTAIFDAEKYTFTDSTSIGDAHETSNVMEYFAAAWSEYYINPANLMARAPQTYAFVERCLCAYTGCGNVSDLTYTPIGTGDFKAEVYYQNYPDLQAAIGYHPEALYQHYLTHGKAEGRNASTRIQ